MRGFVDRKGEVVITPKYDFALGFKNCFAQVKVGNKWGFINTKGEVVVQPKFEQLPDSFTLLEGLAAAKVDQKYGYIDKTGEFIIKPRFHQARPFSENLAAVQINTNEKWGFINTKGDIVIEPQFDAVYQFVDGVARVQVGEKIAYISKTGSYIWHPTN